jgi:DNA replication and repair protein RecF
MAIFSLKVTQFRNLSLLNFSPTTDGLNIISGQNGSGKTNLLEAIYYLSLAKSFRHASVRHLVHYTKSEFSLFAQVLSLGETAKDRTITTLGMQKGLNSGIRLRLGERTLSSITELAFFLPVQVIYSQSHHFFELGPVFRRKYLDWGLFYQQPAFLSCWHHFMKMLRQRNAALRKRCSKQEIECWTHELLHHAQVFDHFRRNYVSSIEPYIIEFAQTLLPDLPIQISYDPGWNQQQDLSEALAQSYSEDYRLGYTQFGPHRADLIVNIQQTTVKHILSRGQQKLLICAMILAQGKFLVEQTKKCPIYLIDDLPAELDRQSRQKLLASLSEQSAQVFITAIESQAITEVASHATPIKVFHVEHGQVSE